MKTKTKQKILKVLAICILFLGNSHLMAQTSQTVTQTVCANSLAEPYLINPPSAGSIYQWTLSGGGAINPVSTSNSITIGWFIRITFCECQTNSPQVKQRPSKISISVKN